MKTQKLNQIRPDKTMKLRRRFRSGETDETRTALSSQASGASIQTVWVWKNETKTKPMGTWRGTGDKRGGSANGPVLRGDAEFFNGLGAGPCGGGNYRTKPFLAQASTRPVRLRSRYGATGRTYWQGPALSRATHSRTRTRTRRIAANAIPLLVQNYQCTAYENEV
jgi:hypothetical protein